MEQVLRQAAAAHGVLELQDGLHGVGRGGEIVQSALHGFVSSNRVGTYDHETRQGPAL